MTLEEQISALSEEYRDHIRPDLEVLQGHVATLRTGGFTPEAMRSLQQLAHMQSGSAGSFGFDKLAEKARATDHAIIRGQAASDLLPLVEAWEIALKETLH
jgi:HPt (histidine-containing phosphotransfer) domain-containing protein